jgi:hypothetical protein
MPAAGGVRGRHGPRWSCPRECAASETLWRVPPGGAEGMPRTATRTSTCTRPARRQTCPLRGRGCLARPRPTHPEVRPRRQGPADPAGRHHDCVELRGVLRRVCAQAEADGESGFVYGRLHALEQARPYHREAQPPAVLTRPSAREGLRYSLAAGPSSGPPGSGAICRPFWSDMCQRDRRRAARGHRAATSAS